MGQDSMTEEFGLGTAASTASIRVTWPSGIVDELFDVVCDRVLTIEESSVDDVPPGQDGATQATGLLSCAPNPIQQDARVRFALEEPGYVRLAVYDAAGRAVRTLADGQYGAGHHEVTWDGRDSESVSSAAGVYFLRIDLDGRRQRRTLTLVR
jgi:hypothetical protein